MSIDAYKHMLILMGWSCLLVVALAGLQLPQDAYSGLSGNLSRVNSNSEQIVVSRPLESSKMVRNAFSNIEWHDFCVTQTMEIKGIGLVETFPVTLSQKTLLLNDAGQVNWLLLQAAGRYRSANESPLKVTFTAGASQTIAMNEPTSNTEFGYTYESMMQPAAQLTMSMEHFADSYKTPKGFIIYAKRETDPQRWTSVGKTMNKFIWSGSATISHTEIFTFITPLTQVTDLEVSAVVIDNNNDNRPLVLEASAGGIEASTTVTGATQGDLLNIVPLTLTQVPTDTDHIMITLSSPPEYNGDSLILVGMNVRYLCYKDDGVGDSGLTLTKMVNNAAPNAGDIITYTVSVTNVGAKPITQVEIIDRLPDGLTYARSRPTSGTYDYQTGLWAISALGRGENTNLEIAAQLNDCTNGRTITNTAEISNGINLDMDSSEASAVVHVGSEVPCYAYLPVIYKNYCDSFSQIDNFDKSNSGWITGTFLEADYSYMTTTSLAEESEYRIYAKDRDAYPTAFSLSPVISLRTYSVKVDVKWNNFPLGDEYGIIFGVKDSTNQRVKMASSLYRFVVNTKADREFALSRFDGERWLPVVPWTIRNDLLIKSDTGVNTLEVVCKYSSAMVFANDDMLWAGNLPFPCAGKVGTTSSTNTSSSNVQTDARFSKFEVCGDPEITSNSNHNIEMPMKNDTARPHN